MHIDALGVAMFSDMSIALPYPDLSSAAIADLRDGDQFMAFFETEEPSYNGQEGSGRFVRIPNVREFPAIGGEANIVNVPVFGQRTSNQVQGQQDLPTMDITINYIGTDWDKEFSLLGRMVGSGTQYLFRFALLNSEPEDSAGDAKFSTENLGRIQNSQFFFIGRLEAIKVTPSLTDATQATITISTQSEIFGAFTADTSNKAPKLTAPSTIYDFGISGGTQPTQVNTTFTLSEAQRLLGWTDANGDTLYTSDISYSDQEALVTFDGNNTMSTSSDMPGVYGIRYKVSDGWKTGNATLWKPIFAANAENIARSGMTPDNATGITITASKIAKAVTTGGRVITVDTSLVAGNGYIVVLAAHRADTDTAVGSDVKVTFGSEVVIGGSGSSKWLPFRSGYLTGQTHKRKWTSTNKVVKIHLSESFVGDLHVSISAV